MSGASRAGSAQLTRTLVAAFDAAAMSIFAFVSTGGVVGVVWTDVLLWGSAAAASLAAIVVATNGPGVVAWSAIGYLLFAGSLVTERPELLLLALGIALMPIVPRPRNSLALGIVVAVIAALVWRVLIGALVGGA